MWQPPTMELMPGFWPPRPSRFWNVVLAPLRRHYLHHHYRISSVQVRGQEHLRLIPQGDGVLLAPNHSHDADPHVMMHAGHVQGRQLYFMAAWQVFLGHGGIDGWVMQRFGAFSVDREGCDRRAIRQATELLTNGEWLVIFPEGEIYHTNERLTPLREGVAFMAITSQRDLDKAGDGRKVWVVPTAIRYRCEQDITPVLEAAVARMEHRFLVPAGKSEPLAQRILRLGEVLLTIKEKQVQGQAGTGELSVRLRATIEAILSRHETTYLKKPGSEDSVPMRVKALRRAVLEKIGREREGSVPVEPSSPDSAALRPAEPGDTIMPGDQQALDDLHLALQLYSYPGDYVTSNPSVERMAETIEKFEEDMDGVATIKGTRNATVTFGPPIDVSAFSVGRSRAASVELTGELETRIRELMTERRTKNEK